MHHSEYALGHIGPGIGSQDGRFVVTSAEWDHNGSWRVVVADCEGLLRTAKTERAARATARRVDPMRRVKSTRLNSFAHRETPYGLIAEYHFTVSRLDLRG